MKIGSRSVLGTLAVLALLALGAPAGAEHGTPGTSQLISRASGPGRGHRRDDQQQLPARGFRREPQLVRAHNQRRRQARRLRLGRGRALAEDDNRYRNIFVRDRTQEKTTLVSRAAGSNGAAANGDSFEPTISQDGTTVAFTTKASNLGDGAPINTNTKVYVRTIATDATKLVSRATGPAGTVASTFTGQPSIDADGGKVAFATFTSLDAADTGTFDRDVYVRTVATDTTTYVSRADGVSGAEGDGESKAPSISGDGSRVAFESVATNLIGANDTNAKRDVFIRDLGGGTTVLASRATGSGGALGNQDSANPSLSNDGTKVAFVSNATNLDAAATSGTNVFVRDVSGNTTTLASRKDGVAGAQANAANFFTAARRSVATGLRWRSSSAEPTSSRASRPRSSRSTCGTSPRAPRALRAGRTGARSRPRRALAGAVAQLRRQAGGLRQRRPQPRHGRRSGVPRRLPARHHQQHDQEPRPAGLDSVPFANSGLDSSDSTPPV